MRKILKAVAVLLLIIISSCSTVKPIELYLSDTTIPQMFTISLVSYSKIDNAEGKSELNIEFRLRLNRPASINLKAAVYDLLKSTVLYDEEQIEIKDVPIGTKIKDFPTMVTLGSKRLEITYPVVLIIPKNLGVKYVKWFDFPILELK